MHPAAPAQAALDLIEQARREPDRLAIWDRVDALTYAQFEALVGTLAREIHDSRDELGGCGILPLVVGRDVWSSLAINAAMRAGIAFTPIDETLPAAAVHRLLERIDSPRLAVVTAPHRAATLPPGVHPLWVPREPGSVVEPVPVQWNDIASVVFTSGSSGEPKGVVCEWATYHKYFDPATYQPPADVVDFRMVCPAPMSFAAGVSLSLRPSMGKSLSIIDPTAMDPLELLETFDRERLNQIVLVPSLVTAVLGRWPAGRRLESVQAVTVFGEPLMWPMVETIRGLLSENALILNYYGATETTSAALAYEIPPGVSGSGRVPLGRPPAPERIRLESLSEDPDSPKELIVRGALARGYWRDPEMTDRVFGVEPDGTRFWRSGDLVRQDADGFVHSVGRADDVVKINGKLVEPSEPERILNDVPHIRRAVVLVQPGPRGDRLVAHVELDEVAVISPRDVRSRVAAAVAPHLVPTLMVRHERLPLTNRGKVDRQLLKASPVEPWVEPNGDRRPSMRAAAVMAAAAEVLGYEGFGPDDDLWELGLDSLGATELVAILEDHGWSLSETTVLEYRTPTALAELTEARIGTPATVMLNADGTRSPIMCVVGPVGDALTYRALAAALGPDQPVLVIRQHDPQSSARPARSVPAIARALVERMRPHLKGDAGWIVGYSAAGLVAYEAARILRAEGQQVRVALLDTVPVAALGKERERRVDPSLRGLARGSRRFARSTWLRVLPPRTLPAAERTYAIHDLGHRAAMRHRPAPSSVPTTLFAARQGFPGVVEGWSAIASELEIVPLDCNHETILEQPYIGQIASRLVEATAEA